ncbi:hypothetical protein CUMW_250700 [Citrus unshiu]|uniref:Uncharacterized protein n=1 Tax=Citrus unshiu TaxID=55188 RepID=A0A2H5QQ00_CITUN|nr:hypothetical protein CUMW_250700 [Citrus unshiu]
MNLMNHFRPDVAFSWTRFAQAPSTAWLFSFKSCTSIWNTGRIPKQFFNFLNKWMIHLTGRTLAVSFAHKNYTA